MTTNKTLKFVTGNANKLKEIRLFLGEHFNVDAVPLEVTNFNWYSYKIQQSTMVNILYVKIELRIE